MGELKFCVIPEEGLTVAFAEIIIVGLNEVKSVSLIISEIILVDSIIVASVLEILKLTMIFSLLRLGESSSPHEQIKIRVNPKRMFLRYVDSIINIGFSFVVRFLCLARCFDLAL